MSRSDPPTVRRTLWVASWAIAVVSLGFIEAVLRLGPRAWATITSGLGPAAWAALVFVVAAFWYGEGVRALQRRFVPHVVVRAFAAGARPGVWGALSAPLFCMSLVGDTRRAVGRAWLGIALIVLAVFVVRALPPPWRGTVDAGVTVALSWGLGALLVATARALVRGPPALTDRS